MKSESDFTMKRGWWSDFTHLCSILCRTPPSKAVHYKPHIGYSLRTNLKTTVCKGWMLEESLDLILKHVINTKKASLKKLFCYLGLFHAVT